MYLKMLSAKFDHFVQECVNIHAAPHYKRRRLTIRYIGIPIIMKWWSYNRLIFINGSLYPEKTESCYMYHFVVSLAIGFTHLGLITVIPSGFICYRFGERLTTGLAVVVGMGAYLLIWGASYHKEFHREHIYVLWFYYFLAGKALNRKIFNVSLLVSWNLMGAIR